MSRSPFDWVQAAAPAGSGEKATAWSGKSLTLAVLLTVLIAAWGRVILRSHSFSYAAAPARTTAPTRPTVTSDLIDNVARLNAGVGHRSRPSLADWAQTPTPAVQRNLFAVPFEDYPIDPAHPPKPGEKGDDASSSPSAQADQIKERQKLIESLRAEAADITLEGTILGTHPRAWINGVLVGVGESVDTTGFRVVRIESRQVFIERDGVQLELSMK